MSREYWLEGPIAGISPLLMPVAHSLLQAQHDVREAAGSLTPKELWVRPSGAASVGFHLRHLAGSMDRLVTYALGQSLSDQQRQALAQEKTDPISTVAVDDLLELVDNTVSKVLGIVATIETDTLLEERAVGRAGRPSNVVGLLFHVAEHTQRHTGQIITTAKILKGVLAQSGVSSPPSVAR